MNTLRRRDVLFSGAAVAMAASVTNIPGIAIAASHTKNGLTITVGNRVIEVIIPFFPEIPPKTETAEIRMQISSGDRSQKRTARVDGKALMEFANVLNDGGKVSYKTDGLALSGQFRPVGDGEVNGQIGMPNGDEGDVQAFVAPAAGAAVVLTPGAAVAIVAIVAIVAVVAILSSTGGSVSASADTPAGSGSVDIQVGDGDDG